MAQQSTDAAHAVSQVAGSTSGSAEKAFDLIENSFWLHNTVTHVCLALAAGCVVMGAIAYFISAWIAYKNTLTTQQVADRLPPKGPENAVGLVPDLGDLAKAFDALKGLVDSLSKASPMIAWILAAMIFTGIAAYVAPGTCPSCEKPGASMDHQSTTPTPDCKDRKNAADPKCKSNQNK